MSKIYVFLFSFLFVCLFVCFFFVYVICIGNQYNKYGQMYACILIYKGVISSRTLDLINSCIMMFQTIFHLYHFSQFICRINHSTLAQTTRLQHITGKFISPTQLCMAYSATGDNRPPNFLILIGID